MNFRKFSGGNFRFLNSQPYVQACAFCKLKQLNPIIHCYGHIVVYIITQWDGGGGGLCIMFVGGLRSIERRSSVLLYRMHNVRSEAN